MNNPFLGIINSLLPEPHASLLNGILFGVKATMPKEFYQALVTTGTLHIIALSGMNITILENLTSKMTLSLGRKISILVTIVFIIAFVLFVGASPSIVRAAIMGSLSLIALYFGKQNTALLTLLIASGIMLLFDFSLIGNISFQLSVLATFGIIFAHKKGDQQRYHGLFGQLIPLVKDNFRLTFSAQLFTLPILLYHFGRISLIAPIANLLVEWVIQPVMALGFVIGILGWIWLPLAIVPAWIIWVPLSYFITVIQILAKIPGASVQF